MKPEFNPMFSLVGRVFLASEFIPAGFSKFFNFQGTVGYITAQQFPLPELAAAAAVLIEILAGILLLIGLRTKTAAGVLAAFTLVASLGFHKFWAVAPDQAYIQQLMFFKNVGLAGGLLMIASLGGGAWTMDAWRAQRKANTTA